MKTTISTIIGAFLTIMVVILACNNPPETGMDSENAFREEGKTGATFDNYYWHEREKIALEKTEQTLYLLYYSADEDKLKEELAKAGIELSDMGEVEDYSHLDTDMAGSGAKKMTRFKWNFIGIGDTLSSGKIASALSHTIYWGPSYTIKNPPPTSLRIDLMIPSERFTVVLKPGTSLARLEELAKENGVEMIGRDLHNPEQYHLFCTRLSKGNTLYMANLFHESGLFETTSFDHFLMW
jgi:hypothetical protein